MIHFDLEDAYRPLAGPGASLLRHTSSAWNAITFSGSRHTLTYENPDEEFIADLESYRPHLPGAEIVEATIQHVDSIPRRITCEVLVLNA